MMSSLTIDANFKIVFKNPQGQLPGQPSQPIPNQGGPSMPGPGSSNNQVN